LRILKILTVILFIFSLSFKAEAFIVKVKINKLILILEEESQEIKRYQIAGPAILDYPLPLVGELKKIEFNPVWYPTPKTRLSYIKQKGIDLPAVIRPGDSRNAMGKVKFVIEFQNWQEPIRIHGTNDPGSIGRRVTGGCIRMHNRDALELAEIVKNSKTKVIIER